MASIPECVRLFLGRKIACYLVGRPFTTMDKRSPSDVVQGTKKHALKPLINVEI